MKKALVALLVLGCVAVLALSGCTIAKISARGVTPIMLNNPHAKVEVIKHFSVSKGIMFDFTSSFDASAILADVQAETNCDAIVNVGLSVQITFGDYCITYCTMGLANAKHLVVEGDAVKAPSGLGMNLEDGTLLGQSQDFETVARQMFTLAQQTGERFDIVRAGNVFQLWSHNVN